MQNELKFFCVSGKKRKCMKCNKPRNHAGESSNVFYCNNCRPVRYNQCKLCKAEQATIKGYCKDCHEFITK